MEETLDVYPADSQSNHRRPRGHAGFSVISCVLFGVNFLCLATAGVLVVVALTSVGPEPDGLFSDLRLFLHRFPYSLYAAILVTAGLVADSVGFLSGVLGLLLPGHRRSWAVAGMALNAMGFVPFVLLVILKRYED